MPHKPDVPCTGGCGRLLWRGTGSRTEPTCQPCRRVARVARDPATRQVVREAAIGEPGTRRVVAPSGRVYIYPAIARDYQCALCGAPAVRTYCSRVCSNRARAGAGNGRAQRVCEVCGRSYVPNYGGQRTCGRDCGLKLRRPEPRPPRAPRVCRTCGKPLPPYGKLYCSTSCYPVPVKDPRWIAGQTYRTPCSECSLQYEWQPKMRRDGRNLVRPGTLCPACIRARRHLERVRRRIRRRELLRGGELIDPQALYERDGWACGICGEGIPRVVLVPHPLAPSVDHVVPLARGGPHSWDNVQAAHFMCNSLKSDRI